MPTAAPGRPADGPTPRANGRIGVALHHISDDMKTIARDEAELARIELRRTARAAAIDAAVIVLGGIVALIGLGLLCVAAVAALDRLIPPLSIRLLIMAAIYLAIGGAVVAVFMRRFRRDAAIDLSGPAGEVKRTLDEIKHGLEAPPG